MNEINCEALGVSKEEIIAAIENGVRKACMDMLARDTYDAYGLRRLIADAIRSSVAEAVKHHGTHKTNNSFFDAILECETPEEMCVLLNANERRFCPKAYSKKSEDCTAAGSCGRCITDWLKEPV